MRPKFEQFEAEGKFLSGCEHYEDEMKRNRQRNRRYDEPGSAPEVELTPADKFRTATFLVIFDNSVAELKKRKEAYATVASRFGFLRTMKELPDDKLTLSANQLCKIYPGDLEPSLSGELFIQFSAFLKTELAERYLDSSSSVEAPVLSEIPSSPHHLRIVQRHLHQLLQLQVMMKICHSTITMSMIKLWNSKTMMQ